MPNNTLSHARRGLAGLLTLTLALVAAAGALGIRTWQVGAALGSALFPVEDIVELAAVAVGTVAAGWTGLHALIALACVLAGRRGVRWAAGERAVARNAPAVVRRFARAAAGAGIGLALTTPTAMALPGWGTGAAASADRPVVAVELGWQPTDDVPGDRGAAGESAPGRSTSPRSGPAPERSSLVNRGVRAGTERAPLVVVEPGDTLWAIAADRLTAERAATHPSDVAAAVNRWHHTNRQVLGGNPDLIRPGMVLRQP
ncbi:LysM peptidoglycan-binding domain-containing protein [Promicromonospora panici]|uniref:LysM peptidoglycan-binding domain-containing protein n=1 Tax=Promicromonospora panici TaxID=2219658 RepID=UPI00101DA231|nr:LysM domain-containing protein [Promicromonospora panici]